MVFFWRVLVYHIFETCWCIYILQILSVVGTGMDSNFDYHLTYLKLFGQNISF